MYMKPLYFLVEWNQDRKLTWSGTCWALFCALQKHFSLIDIDIKATPKENFIHKVKRKLFHSDGLGLYNLKTQRKKITKKLQENKGTNVSVFQFSEVVRDMPSINTYIYIDEHVNNVKLLYEQDKATFDKSIFRHFDYDSICRRNNYQLPYLETCAGIFTMGIWQQQSLIKNINIPKEKVHHVGGGVNIKIDEIDYSRKKGNKFLFVGRDFFGKGGFVVLDAFRILKSKYPNVELHIAGPPTLINTDNLTGVFQYGFVTPAKVAELMNMCDVFCMPSYYDAYGMVFIEALTYGLPCIGRNAFEMPYFIENGRTGFLIDNDDIADLSGKMDRLLHDFTYTENVRAKRDWYIKTYSWETVAERIANVILPLQ